MVRWIGALFILGHVKYQFEIYLLESVLQSFLTDGPKGVITGCIYLPAKIQYFLVSFAEDTFLQYQ
jgi:hypothetical protein